ncbi:MAG: hypothetical protein M1839_004648 [Geoglossum umbratile]|nr:MAG: hypothetical protein M1839_004648 [Geoglossum umbratile]
MSAFTAAVRIGAHAIETDVHLSRDGVVVLSHDATLKRCFGQEGRVIDFDWSYLSGLRTLQEPHERMPRLHDLLEYLATPGLEDIWLMLDIKPGVKVDNDAHDIIRLIAKTIQQVPPSSDKPWEERINLGCWVTKYLPLCATYLPGFPVSHIGFSVCYARHFLKAPSVSSFNLLQKVMMGPNGRRFLRDARAANRAVYVWTVNDASMMRWSIRRGVDGVLTDDPKKFLDISRDFQEDVFLEEDRLTMRECLGIVGFNILAVVFSLLFRWRHRHGLKLRDQGQRGEVEGSGMLVGGDMNGEAVCHGGGDEGKRRDEDEGSVAC